MNEFDLENLQALHTNEAYKLIIARRMMMLERVKHQLMSASTWDKSLQLQGQAVILQVNEAEILIDEIRKQLEERS